MREQANALYAAVSVFKLDKAKGSAQTAVAKPALATPATGAVASFRNEKHLSGHPKERRLVKAMEDKDGEWKEF
jgi:hypothetical protein